MNPKFNEDTLSEQPAIQQLKRLGYEYIHGDQLDPELKEDCQRKSRRDVVLISRLKNKLAEINPQLTQLIRYQDEIPQLFHTNEILIGLNLFGARYGTILSSSEFFHEWKVMGNEKFPNMSEHPSVKEMLELGLIKKEDLSESPTPQEVLIAGILNKKNLLDIMQNFIVYELEQKKRRVVKKVCRYQQFTAVNKILKRVTTEDEKRGIIWHWQGSGKSLTMLFTAVKLRREEKKLKNPIILVVTDRIDLDDQISGTFRNCNFPNPISGKHEAPIGSFMSF